MNCLADVDIAVLAGGLGTRLRGVLVDKPKVLAPINDRPFLDYLLDWLEGFGARRVVLCLGYQADKVIEHLRTLKTTVAVEYVVEPEPLGTAGAVRLARPLLKSPNVMVLNGDSWLDIDLCRFFRGHCDAGTEGSLLCAPVPDMSRFGRVEVDVNSRISAYSEKDPNNFGPGTISAGFYLLKQNLLDKLMQTQGPSIERDFWQNLPLGTIYGHVGESSNFIDIGTPESLISAPKIIRT